VRAIFISYRREDAEGEAGRLFDELVATFGEDSVFMDVAAIEVGRDFRKAIDESVATCGVLLALIGRNWLDTKDATGKRRLDNPSDFVRLETASALKRDIPVIPVLVHGAEMPRAEDLPDGLQELAYRNGVELTGPRWRSDVQILINALRPFVEGSQKASGAHGFAGAGGAAVQPSHQPAPQPAGPPVPKPSPEPPLPASPEANPWRKRLGIVIAAALALGAILYFSWPRQIAVPNLTGVSLADAKTRLESLKLAIGDRKVEDNSSADPGTILRQSPAAGTHVSRGTVIDLVVAQPSQLANVQVPDLVGKSLRSARETLSIAHLSVGRIDRQPAADKAPDIVLDVFPPSGEKVQQGSKINLMVSTAVTQTTEPEKRLPNFAGTWEWTSCTMNDSPCAVGKGRPFAITQNGSEIQFANQNLVLNSNGIAGYRTFYAGPSPGHSVQTEAEADLVDIDTLRMEGDVLILETVFDYRRTYGGHPPGTNRRTLRGQRVAP
jgi:hypothetical protein